MKRIIILLLSYLIISSCQNSKNTKGGEGLVGNAELKTEIGKRDYTLIYFWTTWCGPCRKALKEMLPKLERSLDTTKVQLLVVSVSKDDEKIQNILKGSELSSRKLKLDFIGPDIYLNHKLALKTTLEELFDSEKVWRNSVPVFALVDKNRNVINAHLPKDLDKLLAILKELGNAKEHRKVDLFAGNNILD